MKVEELLPLKVYPFTFAAQLSQEPQGVVKGENSIFPQKKTQGALQFANPIHGILQTKYQQQIAKASLGRIKLSIYMYVAMASCHTFGMGQS